MQVAKRLGSKSPNALGAYEQGKREPSVTQLEKLLKAIAPKGQITFGFAP
jgi:transcriptional regulator with XRE-family HTH domain